MVHASSGDSFGRNDVEPLRIEQLSTEIQTMGRAWGCAIAKSTRHTCTLVLAVTQNMGETYFSYNLNMGKKQTVSLPSMSMASVHYQPITITILAPLIFQIKRYGLLLQDLPKKVCCWSCNLSHTREKMGERLVFESLEDALLIEQRVHHVLLGDLRNLSILQFRLVCL